IAGGSLSWPLLGEACRRVKAGNGGEGTRVTAAQQWCVLGAFAANGREMTAATVVYAILTRFLQDVCN
ncbi:MAG: hypothetical protein ACRC7G_17775, partial [Beijerinckiaceae bacterium]